MMHTFRAMLIHAKKVYTSVTFRLQVNYPVSITGNIFLAYLKSPKTISKHESCKIPSSVYALLNYMPLKFDHILHIHITQFFNRKSLFFLQGQSQIFLLTFAFEP